MRVKKINPQFAYPSISYLVVNVMELFSHLAKRKAKNWRRLARLEADQTAEKVPDIVFVISQHQRLSTMQDIRYLPEWDFVVSHWVWQRTSASNLPRALELVGSAAMCVRAENSGKGWDSHLRKSSRYSGSWTGMDLYMGDSSPVRG